MLRAPICATVFVLFAGGSLAAPSRHVPLQAPRSERPAPAGDLSLDGRVPAIGEKATAEEIVVARGGRGGNRGGGGGHRGGGGGNRGGGMGGGNRGGFSAGHNRSSNRNVNVDRNVNVQGGGGGWDDDDHAAGAALLGAAVGVGVGSMIANDQNNN